MFGIGGTELLVILVVALLVLGPKKLPDLARTLGKAMGEFRRVSTDFQRTLNTEIALDDDLTTERTASKSAPLQTQPDTPSTPGMPQTAAPTANPDAHTGNPVPPPHTHPDAPAFSSATPAPPPDSAAEARVQPKQDEQA